MNDDELRELRDAEALNEGLMLEMGRERREDRLRQAQQKGRESTVQPYKGLLSAALTVSAEKIEEILEPAEGAGRPKVADAALRQLVAASKAHGGKGIDAHTIAGVALRSLFDGLAGKGRRVQSLTQRVGERLQDELLAREMEIKARPLWKHLLEAAKVKGSEDYDHRRSVLRAAVLRADYDSEWEMWDMATCAHVGIRLLAVYVEMGLFELESHYKGPRHSERVVVLSAEAEREMRQKIEERWDFLRPSFRPMVIEPLAWTNPTDGGYIGIDLALMKVHTRQDVERLKAYDMPTVYSAVNAVQRTPWKVNEDVLVVVEELWAAESMVKGLPLGLEEERPKRPPLPPVGEPLTEEQQKVLNVFKAQRRAWFDGKAKRTSSLTQFLQILTAARDFKDYAAIYFPHQLDYRGRMYAVPASLNPQGNDLAKGLLTFSEKRPVGVWGGYWLAVHGANLWGQDKGNFTARVDWVMENTDLIVACAEDPIGEQWWRDADGGNKPWQFLAFCFEWAAYAATDFDKDFESSLPVALDGSCNGLQHFSAMLRDPVGAKAVNLTPAKEPGDIYVDVAAATNKLLDEAIKGDSKVEREMAGWWVKHGVDRAAVKRPVMTTPYGATRIGMKDMVLHDTVYPRKLTFGAETPAWTAAGYLADRIYEAIGTTVASAQDAMDYLRQVARAANAEGLGIMWTTPAGLPVLQRIKSTKEVRVQTKLLGVLDLIYRQDTLKLDTRRQVTSIAPNFVHSLDAAHLMLTVTAMEGELDRRVSWAMVHDSYGTHAGDVAKMYEVLREQFVLMYQTHDPLAELRASIARAVGDDKLPEVPPKGTFDLTQVLDSEFFFA